MNKGRYTDYTAYLNRKKGIISRTSNTRNTKRRLPTYNSYLNDKTAVNYSLDMDISACTRNVVTSSLCTNVGGSNLNSLITPGPAFRKVSCGTHPIPKVTCNRTTDYTAYLTKKKIEIDCNNSTLKVSNYNQYLSNKNKSTNQKLSGKKFVFTGFRDKNLEKLITDNGGEMSSSVSKNTTAVITNDMSSDNSKMSKADELDVPIYLKNEFLKKFGLKVIETII